MYFLRNCIWGQEILLIYRQIIPRKFSSYDLINIIKKKTKRMLDANTIHSVR